METIAAISTATGNGGIGIIRMSGENTFQVLNKIFEQKKKQEIEDIKGYTGEQKQNTIFLYKQSSE